VGDTSRSLTADGIEFDPSIEYFFCDGQQIRSSNGLHRLDDHIGGNGLRVIAIDKLRSDRDAALSDAQDGMIAKMTELQEKVAEFEAMKKPENRSLRRIAQSRNFF